jgi:hypothetical protein
MTRALGGSCHCGAVRFSVRLSGPIETSKCNCSICTKSRFWKVIVANDAFQLLAGEERLGTYRFGSGVIEHRFCLRCGVRVFGVVSVAEGAFVAVSVPCLDLDPEALAKLPIAYQDGQHDDTAHSPSITSYL